MPQTLTYTSEFDISSFFNGNGTLSEDNEWQPLNNGVLLRKKLLLFQPESRLWQGVSFDPG